MFAFLFAKYKMLQTEAKSRVDIKITYRGRPIEIISTERVFGKEVLNIRMLDDNTFRKVYRSDLDKDSNENDLLAQVRYKAIAARIREEVAQKRLLAPYEPEFDFK